MKLTALESNKVVITDKSIIFKICTTLFDCITEITQRPVMLKGMRLKYDQNYSKLLETLYLHGKVKPIPSRLYHYWKFKLIKVQKPL